MTKISCKRCGTCCIITPCYSDMPLDPNGICINLIIHKDKTTSCKIYNPTNNMWKNKICSLRTYHSFDLMKQNYKDRINYILKKGGTMKHEVKVYFKDSIGPPWVFTHITSVSVDNYFLIINYVNGKLDLTKRIPLNRIISVSEIKTN